MSLNNLTIKPNNHRIYQCPFEKKLELLNLLIKENAGKSIVVVTAKDSKTIEEGLENSEIKVIEDRILIKEKELYSQIIIGFDMPIKNIVYMARASKATENSFMILDASEQKDLHFIEMLLGRAIKQEKREGFEYSVIEKEKGRFEKKKSFEKPKKDFKKDAKPKDDRWKKKKKAPNRFLGKDENGKAIFSGKSGERNHRYDGTPRDKWDAPKATGKKINIKAHKPKRDD